MTEIKGRDKIVLITGCSSGIGLETAVQLSREGGYKVIASLRNVKQAADILRVSGCDVQTLDVTSEASVAALLAYIRHTYGRCDVLLNNAGVGLAGNIEQVSISEGQGVFEVNVWGVMRMVQHVGPLMREQGGGLIVGVSSTSGICGVPGADVYASSKHALEGMLSTYRYTVEADNIKVALVNPGPVDTPFSKNITRRGGVDGAPHVRDAKRTHYESWFAHRLTSSGQSVESCVREIVGVVKCNIDKCVVDGANSVRFWNGTSDSSRQIINDLLKRPDGTGGIFAKRVAMAKEIDQVLKGKGAGQT